jgi:hypothetical protein
MFGPRGGLLELLYCAFAFVHTRRVLYETMRSLQSCVVLASRMGGTLKRLGASQTIAPASPVEPFSPSHLDAPSGSPRSNCSSDSVR